MELFKTAAEPPPKAGSLGESHTSRTSEETIKVTTTNSVAQFTQHSQPRDITTASCLATVRPILHVNFATPIPPSKTLQKENPTRKPQDDSKAATRKPQDEAQAPTTAGGAQRSGPATSFHWPTKPMRTVPLVFCNQYDDESVFLSDGVDEKLPTYEAALKFCEKPATGIGRSGNKSVWANIIFIDPETDTEVHVGQTIPYNPKGPKAIKNVLTIDTKPPIDLPAFYELHGLWDIQDCYTYPTVEALRYALNTREKHSPQKAQMTAESISRKIQHFLQTGEKILNGFDKRCVRHCWQIREEQLKRNVATAANQAQNGRLNLGPPQGMHMPLRAGQLVDDEMTAAFRRARGWQENPIVGMANSTIGAAVRPKDPNGKMLIMTERLLEKEQVRDYASAYELLQRTRPISRYGEPYEYTPLGSSGYTTPIEAYLDSLGLPKRSFDFEPNEQPDFEAPSRLSIARSPLKDSLVAQDDASSKPCSPRIQPESPVNDDLQASPTSQGCAKAPKEKRSDSALDTDVGEILFQCDPPTGQTTPQAKKQAEPSALGALKEELARRLYHAATAEEAENAIDSDDEFID